MRRNTMFWRNQTNQHVCKSLANAIAFAPTHFLISLDIARSFDTFCACAVEVRSAYHTQRPHSRLTHRGRLRSHAGAKCSYLASTAVGLSAVRQNLPLMTSCSCFLSDGRSRDRPAVQLTALEVGASGFVDTVLVLLVDLHLPSECKCNQSCTRLRTEESIKHPRRVTDHEALWLFIAGCTVRDRQFRIVARRARRYKKPRQRGISPRNSR